MKTIKLFALTFLTMTICLMTSKASAQTTLYGYEYLSNSDDFVKIKYTRTYSGSGNVFITTYNIYHPTKGYHYITITATHYKADKKVVVEAKEATGGIFAFINKEETTYEIPSLKAFGFRGNLGVLGGDRVPNQLMVKFTSAKYENIKVGNMLGYNDEYGTVFFVLDDE